MYCFLQSLVTIVTGDFFVWIWEFDDFLHVGLGRNAVQWGNFVLEFDYLL